MIEFFFFSGSGVEKILKNFYFHDWNNIKFIIFDSPSQQQILKERYEWLKKKLENFSNLQLFEMVECQGKEHLNNYLNMLKNQEIILRNPQSFYEPGITSSILTVKVNI